MEQEKFDDSKKVLLVMDNSIKKDVNAKQKSIGKSLRKCIKFFYVEEAGKKVIQINRVMLAIVPIGVVFFVIHILLSSNNSSFIRYSRRNLENEGISQKPVTTHFQGQKPMQRKQGEWEKNEGKIGLYGGASNKLREHGGLTLEDEVGGLASSSFHGEKEGESSLPINYRAKQVIVREEEVDGLYDSSLPTGTNFMGELVTTIDTRQKNQWVKVILPFGGSFKGRGKIPKDTIFLGNTQYVGKGSRVFINLSKGVLPSGREFRLQAQVLDSQGQVQGLLGKYHSRRGGRIASVLGLSMISGMTDVLVQKEAVGKSETVTPKASLENAFYHGASKVAELEAQRQALELGEMLPYVTIPRGTRLVINLISPIKGDFLDE